jgi:hypothetical protein
MVERREQRIKLAYELRKDLIPVYPRLYSLLNSDAHARC